MTFPSSSSWKKSDEREAERVRCKTVKKRRYKARHRQGEGSRNLVVHLVRPKDVRRPTTTTSTRDRSTATITSNKCRISTI